MRKLLSPKPDSLLAVRIEGRYQGQREGRNNLTAPLAGSFCSRDGTSVGMDVDTRAFSARLGRSDKTGIINKKGTVVRRDCC